MKKYLYILSIAALGLSSCSSDYLDTKPEAQMDKASVMSTTEKAELAVNGLCKAMNSQYMSTQGLNGEGTILNWYGTFTGNDAQKCNQTGWAGIWNSTYHLRPTVTYTVYPWFYYYKLVSNANAIICNIDNADGAESDKMFLKAQALTFRAYAFFRLTQLYTYRWSDHQGDTEGIILRTDESLGDHPLSTQAEAYAQIYKDLDDAISLYQRSGVERDKFYQPGLDVAYAIYAKAALTREDWQNAAKYAAMAREGHAQMSIDEYINGGFHSENSEWIWGVFDEEIQTISFYSFFAYIGCNSSASNCRNYPVAISKELIDQIPETDRRRYLYLVPTDEEYAECNAAGRSTKSLYKRARKDYPDCLYETSLVYAYMQFKFMVAFYPGGGSFPIIRYAEMLYTEAEADMHLGKEDEAKDLLFEAVAQYDDAYTKSDKTGEELMDEIKLYRRFDLWGEGNDWFDYKRWGQPIVRKTKEQGGSFKKEFAVTINPEDGNAWTWVIPQKETDYNGLVD
jgi:hypothetical protein